MGAARRIAEIAEECGLGGALKVAAVTGDDVLELARARNLEIEESGGRVADFGDRIISANAYLGAEPIVAALAQGADIVVIGRSSDPALFLGPLLHEFDWPRNDWRLLGQGALVGHMLECAKGRRGTIRIAALPSFSAGRLPDVIARFRAANPAIGFVIRDAIASKVVTAVRTEAVDLGVTAGVELHADVEIVHEAADRLRVVFPQRHPLGARRKVTLSDLANFPLVLMDPETSVRAIVDAAFVSSGRVIRPVAEATYMMTAVGLVRAGLGITILPASAKEIDAEPTLRARLIDDARFSRTISLIKRRKRSLPSVCEAFLKELIGAMVAPSRNIPMTNQSKAPAT